MQPIDSTHNRWIVISTLLFGLAFDSISWHTDINGLIPNLTPLILLYWVMALSPSNFLPTAFMFGLLHDVLFHTGLGTYALIYVLLVYPMLHFRLQLRNKSLLQISLFIGLWIVAHQLLVWLFAKPGAMSQINFWLAPLVATLLWPLVFISLRTLRRYASIR